MRLLPARFRHAFACAYFVSCAGGRRWLAHACEAVVRGHCLLLAQIGVAVATVATANDVIVRIARESSLASHFRAKVLLSLSLSVL